MHDTKAYPVPETPDGLSAEAAGQALRALEADAAGDPHHPFLDRTHAQYGDFTKAVRRLHALANPDAQPPGLGGRVLHSEPDAPENLQDESEETAIARADRLVQVADDLARLEAAGVPDAADLADCYADDASPARAAVIRGRRLFVEGDLAGLADALGPALEGADADLRDQFRAFCDSGADSELKRRIAWTILDALDDGLAQQGE